MPEFHITVDGPVGDVGYFNLDAFTRGYIEALFFTETSPCYTSDEWESDECQEAQRKGQADGNLPGDVGFSDLDADTLAAIIADCAAFQRVHADDLEKLVSGPYDYDLENAGRDFWYTRNGHGCGFWDRDLGEIGDRLTEACGWSSRNSANPFPEVNEVFYQDGKVYVS
jgi:hypothetical protein